MENVVTSADHFISNAQPKLTLRSFYAEVIALLGDLPNVEEREHIERVLGNHIDRSGVYPDRNGDLILGEDEEVDMSIVIRTRCADGMVEITFDGSSRFTHSRTLEDERGQWRPIVFTTKISIASVRLDDPKQIDAYSGHLKAIGKTIERINELSVVLGPVRYLYNTREQLDAFKATLAEKLRCNRLHTAVLICLNNKLPRKGAVKMFSLDQLNATVSQGNEPHVLKPGTAWAQGGIEIIERTDSVFVSKVDV